MQSYGYARIILPLSSAMRWLWTEAGLFSSCRGQQQAIAGVVRLGDIPDGLDATNLEKFLLENGSKLM